MTIHVNRSGTWEEITEVYVNRSGTWERIEEIYVNRSGTWESVYVGDVITLNDITTNDFAVDPDNAQVAIMYAADGTVMRSHSGGAFADYPDHGPWIAPQTNMADYEIRATLESGTVNSPSDATGSWLSLSSDRLWNINRTSIGSNSATLTIEIRHAASGVIKDTATLVISATVSSG